MPLSRLGEIENSLSKLDKSVLFQYRKSLDEIRSILADDEVIEWAKEGLDIGNHTIRSWEAATEYFKISSQICRALPFADFMKWAKCGTYLLRDSSTLAISYFQASPEVVAMIRAPYIPKWAGIGRSLYKGTWKSNALSSKFFDLSPGLVLGLPFWDIEKFASIIETISFKSYDVAMTCLQDGSEVLPKMGREREAFLSMATVLSAGPWREIGGSLEASRQVISKIDEVYRADMFRLGEQLAKSGYRDIAAFLHNGSNSLGQLGNLFQHDVLDLCQQLMNISPQAVPYFLGSLEVVLSRVTISQLMIWVDAGIELLRENPDGGIAYFKLESNRSETILEALSSALDLDRVKGVLRLYCRALSGSPIEILSSKDLVHKGIGWVSESSASTDGTKVFLPPLVDRFHNKSENFGLYKVVATHQVAHLEFGSFLFDFTRPSTLFHDLRSYLRRKYILNQSIVQVSRDLYPEEDNVLQIDKPTDMGQFFYLFEDKKLAMDLFTVIEDGRLDYRVKVEYPGMISHYQRVQTSSLMDRPEIQSLPLRQIMVEALILLSLGKSSDISLPSKYIDTARLVARVFKSVLNESATVEDTSEATIRAYVIISNLPNDLQDETDFEAFDIDDGIDESSEDIEQLIENFGDSASNQSNDSQSYESPSPVDYRGDFKPELVQILNKLKMDKSEQDPKGTPQITKEMLENLLSDSPELDLDDEMGNVQNALGMFAENMMREAGVAAKSYQQGQGHGPSANEDDKGGALETIEPRTQVYDEWDFRAGDYKPRWCIVREKDLGEGDIQFFNDTSTNLSALTTDIRRQFELAVPESFRKVRRVIDGEDIDLDAMIEASIDRRMGVTPSEKIWWRRNKLERDVSVVFLLDMSASTAEAVDEGRNTIDDQEAPDDPLEYMMWLRSRREGMVKRNYKRIIDLEKESTTLLIQALETIGDNYGIYGFSGYGRENVEFYIIKDINEPFHDKIKRRIDKISPMHATRMGPAIRHATSKLEPQDTKTKILFLISDGRPQDRGYSREGVEKEYSVHDTHMALLEAKRKSIVPFCLTVDKSGHDYLKTMCGDMSYEVLDNIWNLPQRLPTIYRMLTT